MSEAENRFGEKHLKSKLRAVPGGRYQMAQNYYQKERGLTLKCTQQDRSQKPRSTWKVKLLLQTMIFQQGAQHRRCRSLTFASTITPDCERHDFRNTADIFFVPISEKTSSNRDSEEFEQESRNILYRLEKQSHLARKEHTRTIRKPRSYSNGDEQTWGSLSRDEREGDGTLEPQNYAPIALSKERENNRKRLYSRDKNNDEQISPNEESAGSEQEDKRAFLQGEGRFKHQGKPYLRT